jgi:hypothetical protein
MRAPAILFKLRDIRQIEPWGEAGAKRLHWFGLTDGCYCIDTPAGRLLEHAGTFDSGLGEPWCDYQVARLFEDLIQIWPTVSDPIPSDIVSCFSAWHMRNFGQTANNEIGFSDACDAWLRDRENRKNQGDDPDLQETIDMVNNWWVERRLDTFYLAVKPNLTLWRIGFDVHLAWDGAYPWLPERVRQTFSYERLSDAVRGFFYDFLEMMRSRVESIARDGWTRKDCVIDVQRLLSEQVEREEQAEAALSRVRVTDWEQARERLNNLTD